MSLNFQTLLIASRNPGKIKEFKALLEPLGLDIKSALDFQILEPDETGLTFHENAQLKAEYYQKHTGFPCLADDSGLSIESLSGWPGVHTKDFANPEGEYALIRERLGSNNPRAQMVCVLALKLKDVIFFEGTVEGQLVFPPRGEKGFGVDPIFQPMNHFKTFAETPELKKTLSHRSRALEKFLTYLREDL